MAEPGEGDRCDTHDKEIIRLRDRVHEHTQLLTALQHDFAALKSLIPSNLAMWMGQVSEQLGSVARGLEDMTTVMGATRSSFATKEDVRQIREAQANFVTLEQFKPVRSALWTTAKTILLAFLAALIALVFNGQLKP